jgi:hypothetical protein
MSISAGPAAAVRAALIEADEFAEDGSLPQSFVVDAFQEEDAPAATLAAHTIASPSGSSYTPPQQSSLPSPPRRTPPHSQVTLC